jgi:hypothetical protein
MWIMSARTRPWALLAGLVLIGACGDDEEVPFATTGSARGAGADASRQDASTPGPNDPTVRVDGGGQDASLLDGGLDAALDGSTGDAMAVPMVFEDATVDARVGSGGSGGVGGFGGSSGIGGIGGLGGEAGTVAWSR